MIGSTGIIWNQLQTFSHWLHKQNIFFVEMESENCTSTEICLKRSFWLVGRQHQSYVTSIFKPDFCKSCSMALLYIKWDSCWVYCVCTLYIIIFGTLYLFSLRNKNKTQGVIFGKSDWNFYIAIRNLSDPVVNHTISNKKCLYYNLCHSVDDIFSQ